MRKRFQFLEQQHIVGRGRLYIREATNESLFCLLLLLNRKQSFPNVSSPADLLRQLCSHILWLLHPPPRPIPPSLPPHPHHVTHSPFTCLRQGQSVTLPFSLFPYRTLGKERSDVGSMFLPPVSPLLCCTLRWHTFSLLHETTENEP